MRGNGGDILETIGVGSEDFCGGEECLGGELVLEVAGGVNPGWLCGGGVQQVERGWDVWAEQGGE